MLEKASDNNRIGTETLSDSLGVVSVFSRASQETQYLNCARHSTVCCHNRTIIVLLWRVNSAPALPHIALMIFSVTFLASPGNIVVLSRQNRGLSILECVESVTARSFSLQPSCQD